MEKKNKLLTTILVAIKFIQSDKQKFKIPANIVKNTLLKRIYKILLEKNIDENWSNN